MFGLLGLAQNLGAVSAAVCGHYGKAAELLRK
jgi:hypothetical protein